MVGVEVEAEEAERAAVVTLVERSESQEGGRGEGVQSGEGVVGLETAAGEEAMALEGVAEKVEALVLAPQVDWVGRWATVAELAGRAAAQEVLQALGLEGEEWTEE